MGPVNVDHFWLLSINGFIYLVNESVVGKKKLNQFKLGILLKIQIGQIRLL